MMFVNEWLFLVTELAQGTYGNELEYPVSFPPPPVVTKPWQKTPGPRP